MKAFIGTLAALAFAAPIVAQTPQPPSDESAAGAWCTAFSDACRQSTLNGCGVMSPGSLSCYSQFVNGTCTLIRVQCRCMPVERQGKDVTSVALSATITAMRGQCLNAQGNPDGPDPSPNSTISKSPASSTATATGTTTGQTPSSSVVSGANNLAAQVPGLLFTSAGVVVVALSIGLGGLLL
ncbi:hypothetical protein BGW38_003218 [Lunasporangiospora selenospora]|uniref:Extracellular membrane protein CFEM domain-containing protein n=1 Tax=Lunasporangiospora selenospora TaxID=979761 RepID=A0A9P6FRH6_9FUNG|nr:hypothetical protein BGW38_003218 [Lunasporangiospora selenospora]